MRITALTAIEVLDSRGHPTVQTTHTDHAGRVFVAGVPARGERAAKYNRLTEIATTHPNLPFGLPR